MLWLASASIVGRGKAVKMEKSCSRDEAARLTRNIITMVKADMIAMAYTTSNTNTNCSSHSWHCLISLPDCTDTHILAATQSQKISTHSYLSGCVERALSVSEHKVGK